MTHAITLTAEERHAHLDLDQLKQLVGLVEYDETKDRFPVTGWDALVFVVGNATQTSHYFQSAFGMELVAYSGPQTGNRDHLAFVLESGSCRFVIKGGVAPDSPLLDHHRAHGDGVVDIARGARRRPVHRARACHRRDDRPGTPGHHRRARHRPGWRHRGIRRDPAHPGGPLAV
jgi:catechol 2,3-dioxygenase-like lactoylglutathione lyase family enzyme